MRMGSEMIQEWHEGEYTISTDPARIDVALVHDFLSNSYWAKDIPRRIVERSIAGSVAYGIYHRDGPAGAGERQVGFARVISDLATPPASGYPVPGRCLRGGGISRAGAEQVADALHHGVPRAAGSADLAARHR